MILFKIGATNYTNFIVNGEYDVNKLEEGEQWTDGSWKDHFDLVRTRISGKFTMKFRDWSQYDAFVDHLNVAQKDNGYFDCEIFCINTNSFEEAELKIQTSAKLSQLSNKKLDAGEVEVTVTER